MSGRAEKDWSESEREGGASVKGVLKTPMRTPMRVGGEGGDYFGSDAKAGEQGEEEMKTLVRDLKVSAEPRLGELG